ncbi:Hpt domain-containing protein [Acinetobacter sp. MD2]|uniref:Hpt domain-containing protein n=1 Tax=Acinetobacter sp. MD2 TaxID=2600066 RepID=UPI002D1E6DC8|nr:Hpt domain-containing protein [Acinetobacter sp. MD2]MEB3767475.1 Hpt domain-containing protein [Acinetobacter sp. MD2]
MTERLQDLAVKVSLPEDTYLQQDKEILDIFVEELQEIFVELNQLLPLWLEDIQQENVLKEIRRYFHTLKGSGRMVGANRAGELAWQVEDLLNRVMAKTVELTPMVQQFAWACKNVFEFKLYPVFEHQSEFLVDLRPLIVIGKSLQQQLPCDAEVLEIITDLIHLDSDRETVFERVMTMPLVDIVPVTTLASVDEIEHVHAPELDKVATARHNTGSVVETDLSVETLKIYLEEGLEHLDAINHFLKQPEHSAKETDILIRALHTLKGSSGMAHVEPLFQASADVEQALKAHLQENKNLTESETQLLAGFSVYVTAYLQGLKQSNAEQMSVATTAFTLIWAEYLEQQGYLGLEKISGTVSEILELQIDDLLDAEGDFEYHVRQHNQDYLQQLLAESTLLLVHTAQTATHALHILAEKLTLSYRGLIQQPQLYADAYTYELFDQAHQQLIDYFDILATGQTVRLSEQTQQLLDKLVDWTHPINVLSQVENSEHVIQSPVFAAIDDDQLPCCQQAMQADTALLAQHNVHLEDYELISIFIDEAEDLMAEFEQAFAAYQQDPTQTQPLQPLMRCLHTLKGGANMIAARYLGEIIHSLESIYERLIYAQLQPTTGLYQVLSLVQDNLLSRLDMIREYQQDYPAPHLVAMLNNLAASLSSHSQVVADVAPSLDPLISNTVVQVASQPCAVVSNIHVQRILDDQLFKQSPDAQQLPDADLISIFIDEAEGLLVEVEKAFTNYQETQQGSDLQVLMRYLHTLKGGANMLQATYFGQITHELESIYEKLIYGQLVPSQTLFETIRCVQDQLAERIETIQQQAIDYPATGTLAVLDELQAKSTPVDQQSDAAQCNQPTEEADRVIEPTDSIQSLIAEEFVEEAQSLLHKMREQLYQWFDRRSQRGVLLQLQRDAHTVKGAARMAEQQAIANVASKLDETFEQFAVRQFTSNTYDALLLSALTWLDQAIVSQAVTSPTHLLEQLGQIDFVSTTTLLDVVDYAVPSLDTYAVVEGDGSEPPSMHGEWLQQDTTEQAPEMIRISTNLVEKMIDLAGENAINRSRIEMDMSQFSTTLNEMELAIQRLSDQLRRMEGELESQIIAKHGNEQSRYADFDPLEMDQYSSLNQLSKSLAESASDLIDFKVTLAEKVRDAEGLLLQQSRIQAEMQDGLMRVRLVPFSRITTRLQRLVRQVSSTLSRPVNFEVNNRDLELDRSILERLVTPLEHMLRNAIDHGIETTAERQQAQKNTVGSIEISISRQGADVVIDVRDDGHGIDPRKIEQKARQLGLIAEQHSLSDQELLQFIFHSGLTTAKTVTQISGRGVGLDVVQNDIKALGGHISIHSTLGVGTHFNIRVPTTVSVSDALMVKVIDQQYAIPLAQIERIVRVSPLALSEYFSSGAEQFSLDGQSYKLRYAGEFVGGAMMQPRLLQSGYSLPVLLIKGHNNQTVALLVDQLIGSRAQIVVKPLGSQLSRIDVIGGATILGDGQVCLILDTANLARRIQTATHLTENTVVETAKVQRARQCIMIVDDSVTVRKVTSRLLERYGYDVVTAKDGVDAVEQIEHVKPDLMLLDIEMPRMDGFEVTNILRHHTVYHDLPIIMITSRTGEKHRERAFGLGVTGYMGKPFQEADLLAQIEQVLAKQEV